MADGMLIDHDHSDHLFSAPPHWQDCESDCDMEIVSADSSGSVCYPYDCMMEIASIMIDSPRLGQRTKKPRRPQRHPSRESESKQRRHGQGAGPHHRQQKPTKDTNLPRACCLRTRLLHSGVLTLTVLCRPFNSFAIRFTVTKP